MPSLSPTTDLEGLGGLVDIRARLRERRQAARGEGDARQRSGRDEVGLGGFRVKKEGKNGK